MSERADAMTTIGVIAGLRTRIAELEISNTAMRGTITHQTRIVNWDTACIAELNADKKAAREDAEQAEAALAKATKALRYGEEKDLPMLYAESQAALAERDRESTDLLDAIFQTVDTEDGEEIVAEAFPKGGPAWVLAWYREHPNEEELRARAERSTP